MITSRKRTMGLGETYIENDDRSNPSRTNKNRRLNSPLESGLVIEEVSGNDLFGIPTKIRTARATGVTSDEMSAGVPFLDEKFLDFMSPDEPSADVRRSLLDDELVSDTVQKPETPISSPFVEEKIADEVLKRPKASLPRSFSLTRDDLDLHDEVAKELPRLTTAKVFSQAIARKKELKTSQERGRKTAHMVGDLHR